MDNMIDEYLKNVLTYDVFDNIFKNKISKDITNKIYYDFLKPYCDECYNCCKICYFQCCLQCVRFENRNVCCKWEFNQQNDRYYSNLSKVIDVMDEIDEIDEIETLPLLSNVEDNSVNLIDDIIVRIINVDELQQL